jgi:hypothetical protein
MKDLKIIELLTDIIHYPFKNDLVDLDKEKLDPPEERELRIF